jgi:hypothetical protein
MFRKLKDRLSEVSDEVKRDPRFQSVNQLLAGQPAFKENNNVQQQPPQTAADSPSTGGGTDHYFSLVEDDDIVLNGSPMHSASAISAEQPAVLSHSSSTVQAPTASRMRRTSSGSTSMISEAAMLFPIYESPQQVSASLKKSLVLLVTPTHKERVSSRITLQYYRHYVTIIHCHKIVVVNYTQYFLHKRMTIVNVDEQNSNTFIVS